MSETTNLEERDNKLNEEMQKHPAEEAIQVLVKDAHRRKRQVRILAVSVVLNILLTAGFGFLTYKTNQIASLAQSNQDAVVANCEVANESRKNQRELWAYVISLTPSQPRTEEETTRVDAFQEFVNKTFAERDCQAEINK